MFRAAFGGGAVTDLRVLDLEVSAGVLRWLALWLARVWKAMDRRPDSRTMGAARHELQHRCQYMAWFAEAVGSRNPPGTSSSAQGTLSSWMQRTCLSVKKAMSQLAASAADPGVCARLPCLLCCLCPPLSTQQSVLVRRAATGSRHWNCLMPCSVPGLRDALSHSTQPLMLVRKGTDFWQIALELRALCEVRRSSQRRDLSSPCVNPLTSR
mmetsp:Transcript_63382/g.122059  ORF Transcript_63382/g.122059 Transcript_63382/m.122059 type:complete len:211 (-) Transcript_63382:288-920(-)